MASGKQLFRSVYGVLHFLFSPIHIAVLMWRVRTHVDPFSYIISRVTTKRLPSIQSNRRVWIHCASTGEVITSYALIKRFQESGWDVVVSVITPWGYQAAQRIPHIHLIYAPLDLIKVAGSFMEKIRPNCFILMETEIWPEMIWSASRRGIPVFIANGRISDKAFVQYRKARSFFKNVLTCVQACVVQSERSAERYRALGVPPERVYILGNLKYESTERWVRSTSVDLRPFKQWKGDSPGIIFASWHREEFPLLFQVVETVWQEMGSQIRIVIAPRHIEDCSVLKDFLQRKGIPYVRRTDHHFNEPIILLDTQGELAHVYEIGDITVLGGSFHPALAGHNPIEPAWQKNVVLIGPYHQSFQEIIQEFQKCGSITIVESTSLIKEIRMLLKTPQERVHRVERAQAFLAQKRNISQRTFSVYMKYLHDK